MEAYNASVDFIKDEDGNVNQIGYRGMRANRVKSFTPTPDELKAFTGEYYSEELGTTYTIVFQDSQLVAQHRRHDEFPLSPTIVDHFASQRWWFRNVDFQRDNHGKISGFNLTGGRVRNLRFRRLEK